MSSDTRPQDNRDHDLDLNKAIVDSLASLNYDEGSYDIKEGYTGLDQDSTAAIGHHSQHNNEELTYPSTNPEQHSQHYASNHDKITADDIYYTKESENDLDLENAIGDVFSKFNFNAVHDNDANSQAGEEESIIQDTQHMEQEIRHVPLDISNSEEIQHSQIPSHQQHQEELMQQEQPVHHYQHHIQEQVLPKRQSHDAKYNEQHHEKHHDDSHEEQQGYQNHSQQGGLDQGIYQFGHRDVPHNVADHDFADEGTELQEAKQARKSMTERKASRVVFSPHSSPKQLPKDEQVERQDTSSEAGLLDTHDNTNFPENTDDFDLDAAIGDAFSSAFEKSLQHQGSAGNKLDVIEDATFHEERPDSPINSTQITRNDDDVNMNNDQTREAFTERNHSPESAGSPVKTSTTGQEFLQARGSDIPHSILEPGNLGGSDDETRISGNSHKADHEDSDLDTAINDAFQSITQNTSQHEAPPRDHSLDQSAKGNVTNDVKHDELSPELYTTNVLQGAVVDEGISSDQHFDDDLDAAIGNAFNSIMIPRQADQINTDPQPANLKVGPSEDTVRVDSSGHDGADAFGERESKTRKLARAIGEAFTDERADHFKKAEAFKKAPGEMKTTVISHPSSLKQNKSVPTAIQHHDSQSKKKRSDNAIATIQGTSSSQHIEGSDELNVDDDELTAAISASIKQLMDNKQDTNVDGGEHNINSGPSHPTGDIDDFMENVITEAFNNALKANNKKSQNQQQQLVDVIPHAHLNSGGLRKKSVVELPKDAQIDLASIVQTIVSQMTNQDTESDLDPSSLPISQDVLKELALEVTNHLQSVEDSSKEKTTSVADLPQIDDNVFQHFQNEAHKDEADEKPNIKAALATVMRSAISSNSSPANVLKSLESLPSKQPNDNNEIDLESLQMNVILQNAFNMALENPQDLLSTLDMDGEDLSSPPIESSSNVVVSQLKDTVPLSSAVGATSTLPQVPISVESGAGKNEISPGVKDKKKIPGTKPSKAPAEGKPKQSPVISAPLIGPFESAGRASSLVTSASAKPNTQSGEFFGNTMHNDGTAHAKKASETQLLDTTSEAKKSLDNLTETLDSKKKPRPATIQSSIPPTSSQTPVVEKDSGTSIPSSIPRESISSATKKLVDNMTSRPSNIPDSSKKALTIAETLALHRSSMLNNTRDFSSIRSPDTSKLLSSPSVNPQLSQMLTSLSSHINSKSGSDNNLLQVIRQMTNALTSQSQKSSFHPFSSSRDVPSVYDIVSSYTDKSDRENMIGSLVLTKKFLKSKSENNPKDKEAAVSLVEKALELFHASKSQITASFAHIKDETILSLSESVVSAIYNYTTSKNKSSFITEKPSVDSPEYKDRIRLENRERKKRWREENAERNKDNDLRSRVLKRATATFGEKDTQEKRAWVEDEFNKRREKRIAKQKKDDTRPNKEEEKKTSIADEDPKLVKSVTDIFDIISVSGLKEEPKSSLVATSVAAAATTLLHFSREKMDSKSMDASIVNIMTSLFDSAVETGQTERFKNLSKAVFALRGESYQQKDPRINTRPSILGRGLMKDYQLTSSKPGSVLDIGNLDLNGNQKRKSIDESLTNSKRQKSTSPPKDPRTTPHMSNNISSISKAASDIGNGNDSISSSPPSHLWHSTSSLKMPTYKSRNFGSSGAEFEVKEEIGQFKKGPTLQLSKVSPFISNKTNFSSMKDDNPSPGESSGKGLKRPGSFQRPAYSKPKNRNLGFPPLYSASFSSN